MTYGVSMDCLQNGLTKSEEPTVCGMGLTSKPFITETNLEQQIMEIYARLDEPHRIEFCKYLSSLLT